MQKLILLAGAMAVTVVAGAAPATNAADELVVTASRAGRAAAEMPQRVLASAVLPDTLKLGASVYLADETLAHPVVILHERNPNRCANRHPGSAAGHTTRG